MFNQKNKYCVEDKKEVKLSDSEKTDGTETDHIFKGIKTSILDPKKIEITRPFINIFPNCINFIAPQIWLHYHENKGNFSIEDFFHITNASLILKKKFEMYDIKHVFPTKIRSVVYDPCKPQYTKIIFYPYNNNPSIIKTAIVWFVYVCNIPIGWVKKDN